MGTKVTFFPVENGDMTLIKLSDESSTTVLIDCKIVNGCAEARDVAADLRNGSIAMKRATLR